MQCYPNALKQQLTTKLAPLYLLFGNEPFLIEESASLIREKIRKEDVEYYKINIQEQKAWQEIFGQAKEQFSLWSKTKLFELQFPAKLSTTEIGALNAFLAEDFASDIYLILKIGSLTRQQQQAAWFVKVQQNGIIVPHWSPSLQGFSKWVLARAKERNLHLSPQEIESIVVATENNALAAAQEIERLTLCNLASQEELALAPIQQSQYEVYDLVIAALNQQSERLLKMLASFKDSQVPLPLILWVVGTSLRAFLNCAAHPLLDHERIFRQAGIKGSVYETYAKVAHKVVILSCRQWLAQLSEVDLAIKTGKIEFAWEIITNILIHFSCRHNNL